MAMRKDVAPRHRAWSAVAAAALVCLMGGGVALAASNAGSSAASTAKDEATTSAASLAETHKALGADLDEAAQQNASSAGDSAAAASAAQVGTREFCLSCHDWDQIVDSTILAGDVTVYNKQGLYNVHDNHRGLVNCSDCHKTEGTSTLGCVNCHNLDLPEGWEGYK